MGILRDVEKDLDLKPFEAKKNEIDQLPDLYTLERVEHKALWVLLFSKDHAGVPYLSALEISTVLADVFEVSVSEAAIRMALSRAKNRVHVKTFGRSKKFSIMQDGRESLYEAAKDRVIIVDPSQPRTAIQKLADMFGSLAGEVKICDPYLDRKTLEVLAMIPVECVIHFLSNAQKDGRAFLRHYKAYRAERGNAEIRTILPGQIHDRYLISDREIWSIGHSLNAIGTKQTIIQKLGDDAKRELERWFDATWTSATPL